MFQSSTIIREHALNLAKAILLLLLPIALRPFQFGLGFLMVSEQYSFPGWGCQPHAHPQLSWRTDDFLSGLSPLADQSRF